MNGRILAVDYGDRRIGLALSDETQFLASPLETVAMQSKIFSEIALLASGRNVVTIIVGLPRSLSGAETPSTTKAREFANKLSEATTIPVILWDERFTSKIAKRNMLERGTKRSERQVKANVDREAATVLLQSYLDAKEYEQRK